MKNAQQWFLANSCDDVNILLLISEFLTRPETVGLFTRANGTAWPGGVESVAVTAVVVPEGGEISGTLTCLGDV
jgi:hypothetical protein